MMIAMKRALISIIVFAVAIAAAYFLKGTETYTGSSLPTSKVIEKTENTATETNNATTTAISTNQTVCIRALEEAVQKNNTKYEKGTVLISFESGTTRDRVAEILADHDLKLDPKLPNNFSTQVWTVAAVPQGKEFSVACELKTDTRIKFAGVNPLLELHE